MNYLHRNIVHLADEKDVSILIESTENGGTQKENEKMNKKEQKEFEKQQKKEQKIKDKANQSLLKTQSGVKRRYATSELTQMWIVLKRALLFSRRDWVIFYTYFFKMHNIFTEYLD